MSPGASLPSGSLILTVKNEATNLDALLASVAAQTHRPDQIVLVDGGSTDGTPDIARRWSTRLPLELLSAPGSSISAGRNLALGRASGDIVAVTDAGVRLEPDWLAELIEPFTRPNADQPDVASGFFHGDPQGLFETALAATTLPDVDEIDPKQFLPSSRSVAFRRSLYEVGFRYPEWLDYCEDLVFDLRLRRASARFEFRPKAVVWFRPRPSLGSFACQYFRYARGDGKAGLFAKRHLIRYVTYLGLLPLVLVRRDRLTLWLAVASGAGYLRRPWLRLWRRRRSMGTTTLLGALLLTGPIRLVGDLAKMVGYPAGLLWRYRRYGPRVGWPTIAELAPECVAVGCSEQGAAQKLSSPETGSPTEF